MSDSGRPRARDRAVKSIADIGRNELQLKVVVKIRHRRGRRGTTRVGDVTGVGFRRLGGGTAAQSLSDLVDLDVDVDDEVPELRSAALSLLYCGLRWSVI